MQNQKRRNILAKNWKRKIGPLNTKVAIRLANGHDIVAKIPHQLLAKISLKIRFRIVWGEIE